MSIEKAVKEICAEIERNKTGRYGNLVRYARLMGYLVAEGRRHTIIYNGNEKMITLSRHGNGQEIIRGFYRKSLKKLLEGRE